MRSLQPELRTVSLKLVVKERSLNAVAMIGSEVRILKESGSGEDVPMISGMAQNSAKTLLIPSNRLITSKDS